MVFAGMRCGESGFGIVAGAFPHVGMKKVCACWALFSSRTKQGNRESVPVIQPMRFFLSGGGVRRQRVAIMSGLIETVATDRPPATGSHGGAWVEDLGCAQ